MRRFNVHLVTEVDFLDGDEASDQEARNYEKHLAEALQIAALGVSFRTIKGARVESISVAELKDELQGRTIVVKMAISVSAFEAIVGMLPFPLGSMSYENGTNEKGERHVWLDPKVVEHLGALRWPGESYSDVILRLTAAEG